MTVSYLKYSFYLFLFSICILFSSCHDDTPYDVFVINLATVCAVEDNPNNYYFRLDDGTTLLSKTNLSEYTFKDGQRVFLNYKVLSNAIAKFDHEIEINNISNILTKKVINKSSTIEEDEILGNDPVKIISLWVGDQYLNCRFKFLVGGESILHDINLVYNGRYNDTIYLAFRHNANNDPKRFEESVYTAFNLRTLTDSMSENTLLKVETMDLDGKLKNYILEYKTKNNNSVIVDNESIDSPSIQ